MPQDIDIFKYRVGKEYEYPTIARMARDHLAIPAISASSQSVFRVGSDIVTREKNKLSGNIINKSLCLRNLGIIPEGNDRR